jgi:hypothetical protein
MGRMWNHDVTLTLTLCRRGYGGAGLRPGHDYGRVSSDSAPSDSAPLKRQGRGDAAGRPGPTTDARGAGARVC